MTRARLQELREQWRKQGKSQNQIAREIGISEATWSRILLRKSKPSRDTELAIEKKTGLTREDLIEAR
jgi:transcriptional regulator with XRE-family HTH domain